MNMNISDEKHWYPLYTKSRHEKKAYENLKKAGYEAFLPLKKTISKWSDRKKLVEAPLISSYVFVFIHYNELRDVLSIYGVSRYISFNGIPAYVRNEEIELLRKALSSDIEIEAVDGVVKMGSEIKIISGPFSGYTGKVCKISGKKKLVIEMEAMNKTILVTLGSSSEYTINETV